MAGRPTLITAQAIASERGGVCLSTVYMGVKVHMQWRCKEGHEWSANLDNVKNNGTWCRECANISRGANSRKYTIEYAQSLAKQRGGKCLSEGFTSVHAKMKWECSEGHTWIANMHNMLTNGAWCPHCSGCIPLGIETAQELARERGGQCLSTEYKDNKTTMQWLCADGHAWQACLHAVKDRGSWCPTCNTTTESICADIINTLFPNHFFTKTRSLAWMPSGRFELDLWCEELSLAIEYNGDQHYKFNPYFHRTEDDFIQQQTRDRMKAEACLEANVCLITVPCTIHKTDGRHSAMRRRIAIFLFSEVEDLGFPDGTHLTKEQLFEALAL